MPKKNPKHESRTARYYHRYRSTFRRTSEKPDRTPIYFGILFIAIIAGVIFVAVGLQNLPGGGGGGSGTEIRTQVGDTVEIYYKGWKDEADGGGVFDTNIGNGKPPLVHTIGEPGLLDAFDAALVGVEPGKPKTFRIPPGEGYTTEDLERLGPDLKDLVGIALNFEITITKVTRDGVVIYPTD